MKKLTDRQQEIFDFIKSSIEEEGFSPTRVEIGDHFNIYPNGASDHVAALIKKGALVETRGKMRSIRIAEVK